MSTEITDIPTEVEHTYKVEFRGNSGLFDLGNDTSIEFLQSAIDFKKLKYIEPVRSIFKRGALPFDLLLQRDINDDRINDDLIPYLLENSNSFFPPIIVVILKVNKTSDATELEKYYPKPVETNQLEIGSSKYHQRKFSDLFTVDILQQSNTLQRWFTELRIGEDTRLLAVDGQHRLVALQAIFDQLKEEEKHLYPVLEDYDIDLNKYKNLKIPITFLYMPDIYEDNQNCHTNIVETFRSVFVDINRNARKVSEIRNILLDEHDFRSIFTRNICAEIQNDQQNNYDKYNAISLDEIEWEKESREKQLTNHFAVTNVIILQNIITAWLGKDDSDNFKQILKLNAISGDLEDTNISFTDMKLTTFSHKQKQIIVEHFKESYVEALINILSSLPHILKRSTFVKKMKIELTKKKISAISAHDRKLASKLLKYFFEGEEYKSLLKSNTDLKLEYDEYKDKIDIIDKEFTLDLVRTKMFQEGYFKAVLNIYADELLNIDDFTEFSEKIKTTTEADTFASYWKKVITEHIDILSSGLKNNSGYSATNILIEQIRKIIWIMLIKQSISMSNLITTDSINIKIDKYSDEIKDGLIKKFKSKLADSLSITEKDSIVDNYSSKVNKFIESLKVL